MKNVTVAAVRRKGQWRGALIVDNEFKDALIEDTASGLVSSALGALLAVELPEGAEIAVNLTIRAPEAKPNV